MKRLLICSVLTAGALLLSSCGDDGDGDPTAEATLPPTEVATMAPATPTEAPASPTATEATAAPADGDTLEVTGVDYAFEGVPATVEAGTQITFTNASDAEFHELILFRIPADEERPIAELLALPEEEAQAIVGAPLGVAVALPGEDGTVVEGELVADAPGRYVMLCFIPTGADPEAFAEAMQNPGAGEPPEVEGGPPHVAQGMYAEFTVE